MFQSEQCTTLPLKCPRLSLWGSETQLASQSHLDTFRTMEVRERQLERPPQRELLGVSRHKQMPSGW